MATAGAAPKRNRGWLWYFLLLAVLTILATATLATYNLKQQLTPEQLEAAWQLWKEKGPRSYRLLYTIRIDDRPEHAVDRYEVWVKDGRATQAIVNGETSERLDWYGMDRLFGFIDTNLERDAKKGQPRVFTTGDFDPTTGALVKYIRRVMGTRERVQVTVQKVEAIDP
jgi:hypothetical protein